MRDHSFFFRRRFLFFQFAFVALRFRRRIGRGEYAFLRIARCQIVLRVRDVFRQRRHFFLAQIVVSVYLVCVPSRLARLGPFARRCVPFHHGIQRRRAKHMRFAAFPFSIRLRAFTRGFVRRSNFLAENVPFVNVRSHRNIRRIHFRPRRHQRRQRRKLHRLRHRRVIRRRLRRQMLMRLPFR